MQKLVKRKMYYETIMPVEAYDDEKKKEDKNEADIIGAALTFGGLLLTAGGPISQAAGMLLAGGGLATTAIHNEQFTETAREVAAVEAETDLIISEGLVDAFSAGASAIGEGILAAGAVVGDIRETAESVAESVGNAAVEGMVDAVIDTFGLEDDEGG